MILLALLALLGSVGMNHKVQAQTPNEYRVKAAFILNFARFIEWPGDGYGAGGSLVVGIVGEDPSQAKLVKLTGNFMLSVIIETLGEACAVAGKRESTPCILSSCSRARISTPRGIRSMVR